MKRIVTAFSVLALIVLSAVGTFGYPELHMVDNMHVKNQPDVIADTLIRTEQLGAVIPILLVVHHTNIYPSILERITISASADGMDEINVEIPYGGMKLKRVHWQDIYELELPENFTGHVEINVVFELKMKSGELKVVNNNIRHSKHQPLKVFVGAPPLPRFDNWYYGDTHFHTLFSENQAEFGAPVDFSARMAEMFGLDWLAFTDHSFDLDDMAGDSVTNDPELARWERYKTEIEQARKDHPDLLFITGEELSCGNIAGENVHMLVYDPQKFFVGNGDAYEGESNPDLNCSDVTKEILASGGATFAAHPITDIQSVEKFVINRGNWSMDDMRDSALTGLEAWNHSWFPKQGGFDAWVQLLLEGRQTFFIAGSDAHGDFNYELGGFPEKGSFGTLRTAVFVEGAPTIEEILDALKKGRASATSGPLPKLEVMNVASEIAMQGETITGFPMMAMVQAKTTDEFGPVSTLKVFAGDIEAGEESLIAEYPGNMAIDPMFIDETVLLPENVNSGYVRIEVYSEKDGVEYRGYSNPVWFGK